MRYGAFSEWRDAWVIDGATDLHEAPLTQATIASDASWIATELCERACSIMRSVENLALGVTSDTSARRVRTASEPQLRARFGANFDTRDLLSRALAVADSLRVLAA